MRACSAGSGQQQPVKRRRLSDDDDDDHATPIVPLTLQTSRSRNNDYEQGGGEDGGDVMNDDDSEEEGRQLHIYAITLQNNLVLRNNSNIKSRGYAYMDARTSKSANWTGMKTLSRPTDSNCVILLWMMSHISCLKSTSSCDFVFGDGKAFFLYGMVDLQ